MLIAALFKVAKIWKKPTCLSTEEQILKDMIHTHNGILLSHKKNKILPFEATLMDFAGIMLSEISQRKTTTV